MSLLDRVVLLSGGVGGARFLDGLTRHLGPGSLTAIVNTGDDFQHLGLHISPDLDTCMYTLSGLADEARGWGLAGETFAALDRLAAMGEDAFFKLGDKDLATHIFRTARLGRGERLTSITQALCLANGVAHTLLPASDARRPTLVTTRERGEEHFQEWLVRHRAEGALTAIRFAGPADASPEALEALERATLVVIAPSNPFVSIDPILSLEGVRERVLDRPCIGVSPLVSGKAVKGPLAAMIPALTGEAPSAAAVAAHYGDLLGAIVVERGDAEPMRPRAFEASIVMRGRADRARLAGEVLGFAREAFG
jgi:LPPG:FO 2-phospho-L-lactate transferase